MVDSLLLREELIQRLEARGISCGLPEGTEALYSKAQDLSAEKIRALLAGIPSYAIDAAFERERDR